MQHLVDSDSTLFRGGLSLRATLALVVVLTIVGGATFFGIAHALLPEVGAVAPSRVPAVTPRETPRLDEVVVTRPEALEVVAGGGEEVEPVEVRPTGTRRDRAETVGSGQGPARTPVSNPAEREIRRFDPISSDPLEGVAGNGSGGLEV